MEKRNKIELTERFRQTGATRELVAKFFGDKDSVLIVENQMMKNIIIQNHLVVRTDKLEELSNRILFYNNHDFKEKLNNYETWYLDVCTYKATKVMIGLALDMNKTLIGHYGGMELTNEDKN